MTMTKHGRARFKQRQKIKNTPEMTRKTFLAIERGTLIFDEHCKPGTLCYLFNGYKYIVSDDKEYLITVFPIKKQSTPKKKYLIDQIKKRYSALEARRCLRTI